MLKKATRIEKILIMIVGAFIIGTPIATITITSQGFSYNKNIADMDKEIADLEQETRELEIKKEDKLSYSEIREYAAQGGLSVDQNNVKRV